MGNLSVEKQSSTLRAPYFIYTADGSHPREIDDGIYVERLDDTGEIYKVAVCVADTSKLYHGEARKEAMSNVHAEYWDLPDGELGYDPMINPVLIQEIELLEGKHRNALIVQFIIGATVAPAEVDVVFGKVEVAKNYTYKDLSALIHQSNDANNFSRVADLIKYHFGYNQGGDSSGRNKDSGKPARNVSESRWRKGSKINEAYMVAANHLAGLIMREEGRPAIYRVHDMSDTTYDHFIETNCAIYTREPGPHEGLGIDPYCRVTSPLRRLEDFIMSHHFRLRYENMEPSQGDKNEMNRAIRALNKRAIFEAQSANPAVTARRDRINQINLAAQSGLKIAEASA